MTVAATACSVVLAGGLVACGTVKQLSAADKVSGAFGKLYEAKSFKAELGFDATADQIIAFDKAVTKDKSDQIEKDAAELMAGIKLSIAMSADKPLKDVPGLKDGSQATDINSIPDDLGFDFAYGITGKDGAALADLRYVDGTFYGKADVDGIAKIAGEDTKDLKKSTSVFPKVIQDAVGGKWVSVDTKTFKELAKEATAAAGAKGATPSPAPSVDPKVASGLVNTVKDVISRNVSFEDKGKHEGADHIYVAAPAKAFAEDLLKSVKPVAKDIPGFDDLPSSVPSDFPDKKVGVDVFIKDGALSALSFDLAQFAKDAPADVHLPVKVAFAKDAEVKAPEGATAFTKKDFEDTMAAVMGAAMGGTTKPGSTTGAGTGTGGGAAAATLTDAQVKELAALGGVPEAQIKVLAQAGMGYDQLKALIAAG
ncbi:hypothetical protein ACIRBX_28325 [Kitasatospora sp. NPDC096147]|uniref:hypothetical protein n=1 Tax=Kitasatospora sp. NPDC096147 TaxID=3364093 RepID=UPI00380486AD